jgi:hypothetical protein
LKVALDARPLLSWVGAGHDTSLFLTSRGYRCAPVLARLARPEDKTIALKILLPERIQNGIHLRDFVDGTADDTLRYGYGGGTEERNAAGEWMGNAGWGASDTGDQGHLLSVNGEVANFDGEAVAIDVSCGPFEDVSCPTTGGAHPCNRCRDIQFDFTVLGGMAVLGHTAHVRVDSCPDACPAADNPALDRLKALFAHEETLYRSSPDRGPSRLYRTIGSCTSDRPAK